MKRAIVERALEALVRVCKADSERSLAEQGSVNAPPVAQTPGSVPGGAILVAPRYDGVGRPLASAPRCWCCKASYQVERTQEIKGKTYAWLEPACGCLDVPQALACWDSVSSTASVGRGKEPLRKGRPKPPLAMVDDEQAPAGKSKP